MPLRNAFQDNLKTAMRDKNQTRLATLRLIIAAVKDRDIAARSSGQNDGVSDDELKQMLQSMIKQRRDSIALYEQGGRLELAEQEQAEITIIEEFLPKQLDDAQINTAVDKAIATTKASSIKDMGQVMSALRQDHAGQMDFGKASQLVKVKLGA